jgi:hypothetical protein
MYGDIILYAILHLYMELPIPQHLHWCIPYVYKDQHYQKVTQFAHVICYSKCWHMGKNNWHDYAYMWIPFLI